MEFTLMTIPQAIKDTSFVDENVDDNLIATTIKTAQDLYIHPIVGTAMYDEILAEINAGSVSAKYTTLLDSYLVLALIWWTLYEGVDVLTYKIRNKGIMRETSESTALPSLEEIKRLADSFRNKAEYYSGRATKYLYENQDTYPLINNAGTGIDTIHPNSSNYQTGWFLGGRKSCHPGEYNRNNQIEL